MQGAPDPDTVLARLREHEPDLRAAGVGTVSPFGSVASGEATPDSDIDLAIEFDPAARRDLFRLAALERRIAELLGHRVDVLPEPVEAPRLRHRIEQDRHRVF